MCDSEGLFSRVKLLSQEILFCFSINNVRDASLKSL